MLRFADLELDPATREVTRGGRPIELTRTEFALLELFMRNPRQVLTRSIIFERVWGYDFGYDVELARRLHRLPAAEDRGRRRAPSDPDGSRRRVRAPRAHELPARIALALRRRWRSRSSPRPVLVYFVVADQLVTRSTTHSSLGRQRSPSSRSGAFRLTRRRAYLAPRPEFGEARDTSRSCSGRSTLRPAATALALPVDDAVLGVAQARGRRSFSNDVTSTARRRVLTFPYGRAARPDRSAA